MPRPHDVIFDSRNATNGSLDEPTFELIPALTDVVGMSLLWTNIPFTWYVIDTSNNDFQMRVAAANYDSNQDLVVVGWTEVTYSFELSPGTYTPDALINEFRRVIGEYVTQNPSPTTGLAEPVGSPQTGTVGSNFQMFLEPHTSKFVMYFTDVLNNPANKTQSENYVHFDIKFNAALADILGFEGDVWIESEKRTDGGGQVNPGVNVWKNGVLVQENAAMIKATKGTRLIGPTTVALISSVGNLSGSGSVARGHIEDEMILAEIPVTGNYTSFMFYQHSPEMVPMADRVTMTYTSFKLKLQGREVYYDATKNNATVSYLPLNGEGFQVCVRFYIDDGSMAQ